MEAGIVGLPNVGKSTLFNALTLSQGAVANNYPFCTIEPNVGIVPVPDQRLTTIESFIPTQKVIPASLRLVDIAGIVKGASEGEGLGNKFLSHIRQVDAILQVVRCFENEDITHVDGVVDPVRDIETIETELLLADLQRSSRAHWTRPSAPRAPATRTPRPASTIIEKCQVQLDAGQPIRKLEFNEAEQKDLRKSFGLITAKKPILYVANVDEEGLTDGRDPLVEKVRAYAAEAGGAVVPVCAKIEEELASNWTTRTAPRCSSRWAWTSRPLATVAQAAYKLLGLESFYTAGEKEIRAWTIPVGATAPQAAGVIHTDFEKGFIRAEVYNVEDLVEHKTEAAIRSAGKMRSEGKAYVMADGDVCHFLFNV